jgi:hypothetical protein
MYVYLYTYLYIFIYIRIYIYMIGLHVDCCLGGFILPFAKKLGYSIPDFDFHVPGVSSMSLDTHKYGYALKGTSVLLYSNKELRQAQYFCYADWTGGLYTTPTLGMYINIDIFTHVYVRIYIFSHVYNYEYINLYIYSFTYRYVIDIYVYKH